MKYRALDSKLGLHSQTATVVGMASEPSDLNVLGLVASLAGSYLKFASAVITAAIWPIAALLTIWMFRSHLIGLLPLINRLELWGVKVDINQHLNRAEMADAAMEASVGRPLPQEPAAAVPPVVAPEEQEGLTESEAVEQLRKDPSQVSDLVLKVIASQGIEGEVTNSATPIFDAWATVRAAARNAAQAAGLPTRSNVTLIGVRLADSGLVPPSLVQLLHELETVYGGVAQSPKSANLSSAIRFASLADRAISQLNMVGRSQAAGL